jgi:hypothetical protein
MPAALPPPPHSLSPHHHKALAACTAQHKAATTPPTEASATAAAGHEHSSLNLQEFSTGSMHWQVATRSQHALVSAPTPSAPQGQVNHTIMWGKITTLQPDWRRAVLRHCPLTAAVPTITRHWLQAPLSTPSPHHLLPRPSSLLLMGTSTASSPCNESSTCSMHWQVAAVAPLATAGWLTSMQNTWITGCGARTMYSLVATIS